MLDPRMRSQTMRAIPPVALGIDWMLVGLDARTRPPCLLLFVCDLFARPGNLAQKIKLLAHDNKPRAGCLLNLPAASGRPASGPCNCAAHFQRLRIGVRWRCVNCLSTRLILPHAGFDREQDIRQDA